MTERRQKTVTREMRTNWTKFSAGELRQTAQMRNTGVNQIQLQMHYLIFFTLFFCNENSRNSSLKGKRNNILEFKVAVMNVVPHPPSAVCASTVKLQKELLFGCLAFSLVASRLSKPRERDCCH